MRTQLPDKTYFKIGEVASIVGVEPHTIRYWEKEFRSIRPAKTRSKQRLFRQKDLRLLLVIRHLLHAERFTIDGARRKLKDLSAAGMTADSMLDAIDTGRPLDPDVQQDAEATADLRAEIERLQGELDGNTAELDALRATDAAKLERDVAKANATCDALRDTVDALRGDLEKARARVSALESENIELRNGGGAKVLRDAMLERWNAVIEHLGESTS